MAVTLFFAGNFGPIAGRDHAFLSGRILELQREVPVVFY